MADRDRGDLRRRLEAGEWLTVPEAAALLGVVRSSVHRWVDRELLRWRNAGGSDDRVRRVLHPEDLLGLVREREQIRVGRR